MLAAGGSGGGGGGGEAGEPHIVPGGGPAKQVTKKNRRNRFVLGGCLLGRVRILLKNDINFGLFPPFAEFF